jgi:hypothetical protein
MQISHRGIELYSVTRSIRSYLHAVILPHIVPQLKRLCEL